MKYALIVIALCFCVVGYRAQASSLTVVSPGSASLGALSSLVLSSGGSTTEISSGFSYGGGIFSVLYTQTVSLQIQSAGPLTNTSGDQIPVQLCQSPDCNSIYTNNQIITFSQTDLIGFAGLFNGINGTLPLYVRIPPGQYNVSSGIYNGNIIVGWTWDVCEGIGFGFWGGSFCFARDFQGTPVPETIPLSFTVTSDCRINAPNVVFAPSPLVSSFEDVHQALTVGCTKGSAYTVGMSAGQHADGISRVLQSAAGERLRYEIYKKSTQERWGSNGDERQRSADADVNPQLLDGRARQTFSYTARILKNQSTPKEGVYNDNLVVDIQF